MGLVLSNIFQKVSLSEEGGIVTTTVFLEGV
jgi:hypothetical protein